MYIFFHSHPAAPAQCTSTPRAAAGFTLLETIVAVGIIAIGVLSLILLSTTSILAARKMNNQFLAANFAREGIEIVRSIRDANWLGYDSQSAISWTAGLEGDNRDRTAVPTSTVGYSGTAYELHFAPDDFGSQCYSKSAGEYDCSKIWYDPNITMYVQSGDEIFEPEYFQPTMFSRLITLYPICGEIENVSSDTTMPAGEVIINNEDFSCEEYGLQEIGLDVIVAVQWPVGDETENYILEEYLYDWKY
ncbi:MAG: prepilin-type N-terminal cleavage/methylation domain-containing protein [Candidatus Kerfeldbacteria bacterium]|nr:prepilin-type N-terminal cleavage/methylation domain-containing protein [Candidatus Kerfeldbacteria bacterium]